MLTFETAQDRHRPGRPPRHARAARPPHAQPRRGRNPHLHARGHLRHGQGRDAAQPDRHGCADHSGQHLPPVDAPWAGRDAELRRPAPVREMGQAHPHRLGRLPGLALGEMRKISEEGVRFSSPVNGDKLFLTPEISMQIQTMLNSDIVMQFDECTPYETKGHLTTEREARSSMELIAALGRSAARPSSRSWRTPTRCSASCRAACSRTCARNRWTQLVEMDFPGYAVGGVSVGEPKDADAADHGAHPAPPARPQAALPDGRGHARRPGRGRGAGRGHVRLRDAHAQRAQRHAVHPLRRPEDPQRPPQERPRSRWMRAAPATPAPAVRA